MRIQILLFVKPEVDSEVPPNPGSSEDHSLPRGFALTQSKWHNHYPLKFLERTIPVVSHDQVSFSPKDKYEVIEVWEDNKFIATSLENDAYTRQDLHLYVEPFNVDLVRRLFPKNSNVYFVTNFRHNVIERALVKDNLKTIEKLSLSGADISYRHPEGGTLAHFAAEKASGPLIKLLHSCGADLNVGRKDGIMPLHIAVNHGCLETVKILLENGANIEGKMDNGFTPLHRAAATAACHIVELLLKNYADVNAITNNGWTPLHLAADKGYMEICTLLLRHRASRNSKLGEGSDMSGATPLHVALKKKRSAVARKLIDSGASLNVVCAKGRNALNFAVAANDLATVDHILSRQPDVKKPGNQKAFRVAFGKNGCHHKRMIERMLECGFMVEARDAKLSDVFFGAIHKNFHKLVQKLLDCGADVHQYAYFLNVKTRPINVACQYADKDMVQLLLDHGADPLVPRGTGRDKTPIADAVEFGKVEVVKLLLENRISVYDRPDLLHKTTVQGDLEKLELLLENGADPNCKASIRPFYGTPISIALNKGNVKAVNMLMRYGAHFDFRDIDGTRAGTNDCLQAFFDFGFADWDGGSKSFLRNTFANDADDFGYYELSRLKECAKTVAQHLIKMQAAGKNVGRSDVIPEDYLGAFRQNDYRRQCEEEIASLKGSKIGDTEITFFDVLIKSTYQISRYGRNASIVHTLTNFDFKTEYPIFGSIVDCKFRQGCWRRDLIDRAVKALSFVSSQFTDSELPYEVMEYIISFLRNQDIIIFQMCISKK